MLHFSLHLSFSLHLFLLHLNFLLHLVKLVKFLLHSGKAVVEETVQTACVIPVSVQVLTVSSFGMRSPLQEYTIDCPARNWPLMSAGIVVA